MRWFVHVLARLTIAATCTNSAAAMNTQVRHGKHLYSAASNLLEHLMPGSSKSLEGLGRPYGVPNCQLPSELSDNRDVNANPTDAPRLDSSDVNSSPTAILSIDRAIAALLWSLTEGFALFAMAHSNVMHADESPIQAKVEQPEENPKRERPPLALVSSTHPEVTKSERESGTGRTRSGFEALSPGATLAELYGSSSFDADRSDHPNWLARSWSLVVNRWQGWRREQEIKRAVATLVVLDDRISGFPTDPRSSAPRDTVKRI
jgi:hypothetical protein